MLSIIIPALNEEKYLPQLLEAIGQQRFSDYEVIVADAGSTDATLKIAESRGCKVIKGGMPARGRNQGAKIAQGDVLLFMDADNVYLPKDFLKNIAEEFKNRNLDVASFPICPAGNGFDRLAYRFYNNWVDKTQRFLAFATNGVLVKKEIHQKINGFDEEIKIAEDHDFAQRAAKVGKFGFIKMEPVLTSVRRFETDGRLKTYLKYVLAGLHIFFLGPVKSDIFKYRFNQYSNQKENEL